MIRGPVSYGLQMILYVILYMVYQLHHPIFTASAMGSFSHHFIITTTLSPLYRLGHQLTLVLFKVEVLRIAYELNK